MRRSTAPGSGSLRSLVETAGLDKAVVLTLATRAWQAGAGVVSLLLIALFFAPEIQGFYYTFLSLLALQTFMELGLNLVVLSLASHEWSKLELNSDGRITGDEAALSRLASLARFVGRWYSLVSIVFITAVGIGGYLFLSGSHSTNVSWEVQWWTVVALSAVQLWLMPFLSILEGCNQVVELNRFRMRQAMAETLAIWILLVAGTELWVLVGSLTVKVVVTLLFLHRRYGPFFQSLRVARLHAGIPWRLEIWPMQWRLAVQGAFTYLFSSLFVPIMFHFYGAKVAGQMGMTLQVVGVVQTVAMAWVQTKVPMLGVLIARREYVELDTIWGRASKLSIGFALAGSFAIMAGVWIVGEYNEAFASRLLNPFPIALFLVANILMVVCNCQTLYLRAHAREPFVVVGVLSSLLIGILVYLFGSRYGPNGAAISYLAGISLFVLPATTWIWVRRREEWQVR